MYNIDKYTLICNFVHQQFKVEPTMEAILFLIGIQELGVGLKDYDRDEKMNLIHLGTLCVLSQFGYYTKAKEPDRDNWPIYQQNYERELPVGEEQEQLIKNGIITYFETKNLLN